MSDVSSVAVISQEHTAQAAAVNAPAEDAAEDEDAEDDAPAQDERELNALLRKAENAFAKGKKAEVLSRLECGRWCHAIYLLRKAQNYKDRGFTSTLIFNRLAVHADSKRECDATELAKNYQAVELLSPSGAAEWIASQKRKDKKRPDLTIGKIGALSPLIACDEETETYFIRPGIVDEAKALFVWACGEGLSKPSPDDIRERVLKLTDPKKAAEKAAEKAAAKLTSAPADASADAADDEDEPEQPENLISTDAVSRTTPPNWKDVGEHMAALVHETSKQAPEHIGDVFMEFAKRLPWNSSMVKGVVAGIADMKDAESAQRALQEFVNVIGDEYGIFADAELREQAA
jgi:hypothetical protein